MAADSDACMYATVNLLGGAANPFEFKSDAIEEGTFKLLKAMAEKITIEQVVDDAICRATEPPTADTTPAAAAAATAAGEEYLKLLGIKFSDSIKPGTFMGDGYRVGDKHDRANPEVYGAKPYTPHPTTDAWNNIESELTHSGLDRYFGDRANPITNGIAYFANWKDAKSWTEMAELHLNMVAAYRDLPVSAGVRVIPLKTQQLEAIQAATERDITSFILYDLFCAYWCSDRVGPRNARQLNQATFQVLNEWQKKSVLVTGPIDSDGSRFDGLLAIDSLFGPTWPSLPEDDKVKRRALKLDALKPSYAILKRIIQEHAITKTKSLIVGIQEALPENQMVHLVNTLNDSIKAKRPHCTYKYVQSYKAPGQLGGLLYGTNYGGGGPDGSGLVLEGGPNTWELEYKLWFEGVNSELAPVGVKAKDWEKSQKSLGQRCTTTKFTLAGKEVTVGTVHISDFKTGVASGLKLIKNLLAGNTIDVLMGDFNFPYKSKPKPNNPASVTQNLVDWSNDDFANVLKDKPLGSNYAVHPCLETVTSNKYRTLFQAQASKGGKPDQKMKDCVFYNVTKFSEVTPVANVPNVPNVEGLKQSVLYSLTRPEDPPATDPKGTATFLPSSNWPSDHYCVFAILRVKPEAQVLPREAQVLQREVVLTAGLNETPPEQKPDDTKVNEEFGKIMNMVGNNPSVFVAHLTAFFAGNVRMVTSDNLLDNVGNTVKKVQITKPFGPDIDVEWHGIVGWKELEPEKKTLVKRLVNNWVTTLFTQADDTRARRTIMGDGTVMLSMHVTMGGRQCQILATETTDKGIMFNQTDVPSLEIDVDQGITTYLTGGDPII